VYILGKHKVEETLNTVMFDVMGVWSGP